MRLEDYIKHERQRPITDDNIRELVVKNKKLKIRDYMSLNSKDTLHSLLPTPGSGVVLFWRSKKDKIGHFNLLLRNVKHHHNAEFEFFDSYGLSPQQIAAMTSHDGGKRLIDLFKGHNVYIGRHKYQSRTGDVNTCGRYVAFRFNCELFTYEEFRQLLNYRGISPDDLVTLLSLQVDFGHLNSKKMLT